MKAGLPFADVRTHFPDFRLPNELGDTCPKSGHPLRLRMGKNGLFVACAGYPDCDFTVDMPEPEEDAVDATRARRADVRGVQQPDEAPDGAGRLRRSSAARPIRTAAARSP